MGTVDLVATLRLDLADPEHSLFGDETLARCLLRGVFPVARDLGISLSVDGEEIAPEPVGEAREFLLLMGRIHACQTMRAQTANAYAFSSADKRVDKTKQPEHWAKLETDLRAEYGQRLAALRASGTQTGGAQQAVFHTVPAFVPVIYGNEDC